MSSTPTSAPLHFLSYIHNTCTIHCSLYTAHLSFLSKNGTCTQCCAVARFPRKFCRSMYPCTVLVSPAHVFFHHFVSHVLVHYYYDRTLAPLLLHRSRTLIIIFVFYPRTSPGPYHASLPLPSHVLSVPLSSVPTMLCHMFVSIPPTCSYY